MTRATGPMKAFCRRCRFTCWLLLLPVGLFLLSSPPSAELSARPAPTVGSLAPGSPSVLVINQESPNYPEFGDILGKEVEMLLRHFTPNTTKISEAQYTEDRLSDFDRVVVVGNDAVTPLPSVLLEDIARTDRPVLWLGYGLGQLPVDVAAAYGFSPGNVTQKDIPGWVEYKGRRYPADLDDYHRVRVASPSVRVLATYAGGSAPVPYILRGNNLWYVNGLPHPSSDYPVPSLDAPPLVFADALHDFFGTSVAGSRRALIRLEDVSVHIDPARIIETVDYLRSQRVPFALGVIPAQRFEDGSVVALSERPGFVRALRYAQDNGGTIVLHGYHHTFGSGEDYEFWDAERGAPIRGETRDLYARKVEDGIRVLRDFGIEPRLWETPHYAASPLAYRVFSRYFSHAIENREPVAWLPYPSGPDEYGQTLIPENIGYINPAEDRTVAAQLQRADLLRIVRDGWAVGFYHPASIPLSELKALVDGLRQQGYAFADLRALPTEVNSDYRPGPARRLATWLTVDLVLSLAQLKEWPERQFAWLPAASRLPWLPILVIGVIIVFLVRLRKQWQTPTAKEIGLTESSESNAARRRAPLPPAWTVAIAAGATVLFVGMVVYGHATSGIPGSDRLKGWSSLDWTVKYDGYGEVGVEGDAASLKPQSVGKPADTSAALALAYEPGWQDYSFKVQMKLQQQLRRNSAPNPWETGWLLFRYKSRDRSYYLAHKTNGLELGKLVPPKGTGQVFLATTPGPPAEPGRWYDYRIDVRGPTIRVYVDEKLRISYTDPDPIPSGGVGLYTEDAHVYFRHPSISEIPPDR